MIQTVINLACPSCGAPVTTSTVSCEYCRRPIVITTFNSIATMPLAEVKKYADCYSAALVGQPGDDRVTGSLAMCYLKLKLYDKAISAFEKAIEEQLENPEIFFYAAVALLKGKKAFLATRENIDRIEDYINAAVMIEPRGIFHYFHAYIKYDYFSRKHFITTPTYQEALSTARVAGFHASDVEQLFLLLDVERPGAL